MKAMGPRITSGGMANAETSLTSRPPSSQGLNGACIAAGRIDKASCGELRTTGRASVSVYDTCHTIPGGSIR